VTLSRRAGDTTAGEQPRLCARSPSAECARDRRAWQDPLSSFLTKRASDWGDETSQGQPLDRCLHHMICCIVRTVEEDHYGKGDMSLTPAEVKHWAKGAGLMARL
jgi:hypothetical protein